MSMAAVTTEFTVIAHRGQSADRPENTFLAFERALEQGFTHIEMDVQLSSDGIALILHDGDLRRVVSPQHSGSVMQRNAAEVTSLDVGSWFAPQYSAARIPRLSQVLQRYKGRIHLHLELKSEQPELPSVVAAELRAAGWEVGAEAAGGSSFCAPGLTLTSFHLAQLEQAHTLLPHVRLGWLVHGITSETIAEARAASVNQLCPRANIITGEAVAAALQAGFSVRGWGVKSLEHLMRLRDCGVQGCTADWPDKACTALMAP